MGYRPLFFGLAIATLAYPTSAFGHGPTVAVDIGYDFAFGGRLGDTHGMLLTPRVGYEFQTLLFYVRPELGSAFALYSPSDVRLWGGIRAGLTTPLSPALYVTGGPGFYDGVSSGSFGIGAALDLRIPVVSGGLHLEYAYATAVERNWISPGFHAELRF